MMLFNLPNSFVCQQRLRFGSLNCRSAGQKMRNLPTSGLKEAHSWALTKLILTKERKLARWFSTYRWEMCPQVKTYVDKLSAQSPTTTHLCLPQGKGKQEVWKHVVKAGDVHGQPSPTNAQTVVSTPSSYSAWFWPSKATILQTRGVSALTQQLLLNW